MKIKSLFVIICLLSILLSACGKGAPEAGSQPGTSSQPPTSSSTGTTAPTPKTAPPTTAPPVINQEVTPKASFPWDGREWSDGRWQYPDSSILDMRRDTYEKKLPLDQMKRVYYGPQVPALLETYPDETYFIIHISTTPMAHSVYGTWTEENDDAFDELCKKTCAELRQRLIDAGYAMYPTHRHDDFDLYYVTTIMSVAEMKALNCGDDLSVFIQIFWGNGH